ncbi:unnamed protein product [Lactuca saligna]|uniref:Uncharacterized protein n=1 Tax=Lactuca saligna TaxID=75948 RepID=A0AA35V1Q1_LACSI|nr:unnamed protein product [Lactuca saligna]
MEDKKDGILTDIISCYLRKRGMLRIECPPGVMKGKSITYRSHWREIVTSFIGTLIPFGDEVISITGDDINQSAGMLRAFKQPIVCEKPTKAIPTHLSVSN